MGRLPFLVALTRLAYRRSTLLRAGRGYPVGGVGSFALHPEPVSTGFAHTSRGDSSPGGIAAGSNVRSRRGPRLET
jgi:hypothetical protein